MIGARVQRETGPTPEAVRVEPIADPGNDVVALTQWRVVLRIDVDRLPVIIDDRFLPRCDVDERLDLQ